MLETAATAAAGADAPAAELPRVPRVPAEWKGKGTEGGGRARVTSPSGENKNRRGGKRGGGAFEVSPPFLDLVVTVLMAPAAAAAVEVAAVVAVTAEVEPFEDDGIIVAATAAALTVATAHGAEAFLSLVRGRPLGFFTTAVVAAEPCLVVEEIMVLLLVAIPDNDTVEDFSAAVNPRPPPPAAAAATAALADADVPDLVFNVTLDVVAITPTAGLDFVDFEDSDNDDDAAVDFDEDALDDPVGDDKADADTPNAPPLDHGWDVGGGGPPTAATTDDEGIAIGPHEMFPEDADMEALEEGLGKEGTPVDAADDP